VAGNQHHPRLAFSLFQKKKKSMGEANSVENLRWLQSLKNDGTNILKIRAELP